MSLFQEAREVSIVAVAERLGLPVHRGGFIHCPDHRNGDGVDANPSCSLKGSRFRCWSCGNSGSTVDLVAQVLRVSPKEAAEWITGQDSLPPAPSPFLPASNLSAIIEALLTACGDPSPKAMAYLTGRGISERVIRECRITDVSDYGATQKALIDGFDRRDLVASGVFSTRGNLKFYRHALLFPFLDHGRPVFLTARRFTDEKPKYLSVNGHIPCLFNQDALEADDPWIAEGVTDTLTLLTEGKAAVGLPGASFPLLKYLPHFRGKTVTLALDGDEAGQNAQAEIARLLKDSHVRLTAMPEGQDVNSYYRETGLLPPLQG